MSSLQDITQSTVFSKNQCNSKQLINHWNKEHDRLKKIYNINKKMLNNRLTPFLSRMSSCRHCVYAQKITIKMIPYFKQIQQKKYWKDNCSNFQCKQISWLRVRIHQFNETHLCVKYWKRGYYWRTKKQIRIHFQSIKHTFYHFRNIVFKCYKI